MTKFYNTTERDHLLKQGYVDNSLSLEEQEAFLDRLVCKAMEHNQQQKKQRATFVAIRSYT